MAAPAYTIHSSGGSISAQQAESPHSPRFYRHNPKIENVGGVSQQIMATSEVDISAPLDHHGALQSEGPSYDHASPDGSAV